MCGRLVTQYVNLTDTIAVPAEWPAQVIQKFLVSVAEQAIDAVNAGKPVILQIYWKTKGALTCFRELVGSYVIDVIFDMNDKNMEVMNDVPRPESYNPYDTMT
nr:BV-like protein [Cotesia vestalis bracovirus]